ncbi:MAG: CehA/McbA family metallohydrolase [Kofleriaceae bacterium]
MISRVSGRRTVGAAALVASVVSIVACATHDIAPPTPPTSPPEDAAQVSFAEDAPPNATPVPGDAPDPDNEPDVPTDASISTVPSDALPVASPPPPIASDAGPEIWLRGSTHVHAKPSGDSVEPIANVIRWYESRGYDFMFLTDHNRVSEIDPATQTPGQVVLRPVAPKRLIVFSGIELTHNPSDCIPPGDASGKCRIHVNLLGPTARPVGKITWANRKTRDRLLKYDAALVQQQQLGGLAQINHPNWFWGMTPDVLAELGRRGYRLVEIANSAFAKWNDGDKDHPSMDALWDAALMQGVTLWGVASDDAHDYGPAGGQYPAGGSWIVVKAQRDPTAILAAIDAGRFYASSGVELVRTEVDGDELVVELAPKQKATIQWIENGRRVGRATSRIAKRALPDQGYLRAVVTRDDGKRAWVQPARRQAPR